MATETSLNAMQRQKLMEGLKELATMIAAAYRCRVASETDTEPFTSTNYEEPLYVKEKLAQCAYPEACGYGGEYSETVKVESLLRRRAHQVGKSRTLRPT